MNDNHIPVIAPGESATVSFGKTEIHHLDGVTWFNAPIPRRWHRCKVQTWGYINYFTQIDRCACGAIRRDGGRWRERNQRAKHP